MNRGGLIDGYGVYVLIAFIFFSGVNLSCNSDRVLNPIQNLEWKTYTTADGLSYNLIYDLAIDSLDRIWIATLKGINVFDGVKWDTIDASDGLLFDNARVLHFDGQGNLWIGYAGNGNGLVKYDGATFTRYTTADGLSDNRIEGIGSQPNGAIWVGTVFGGTCKFEGNQWTCYDTQYVNDNYVYSIFCENDSSVWFGTSDGVTHYDGNNWNKYLRISDNVEPEQWYKQIGAIAFDSYGVGWFGFFAGVYRYSSGKFKFIDELELAGISDIAIDKSGRVWFSSYSKGVYCYWNGGWSNFSVADGLPDSWVSSVAIDSKGNIWFGTGNGLTTLQPK